MSLSVPVQAAPYIQTEKHTVEIETKLEILTPEKPLKLVGARRGMITIVRTFLKTIIATFYSII